MDGEISVLCCLFVLNKEVKITFFDVHVMRICFLCNVYYVFCSCAKKKCLGKYFVRKKRK